VPDYTFVVAAIGVTFVVMLVLLLRMITIIQPGQVGVVYLLGAYKRGLVPGFNIVSPLAVVYKVRVGGGPNHVLGMLGVAETPLGPDRPSGSVRIGNASLVAQSVGYLQPGATVRVLKDLSVGSVMVGGEPSFPAHPTVGQEKSGTTPLQ